MPVIIPPPPPDSPADPCPRCGQQGQFVTVSPAGLSVYSCKSCNENYFGKTKR